jgi:hypothetical protein
VGCPKVLGESKPKSLAAPGEILPKSGVEYSAGVDRRLAGVRCDREEVVPEGEDFLLPLRLGLDLVWTEEFLLGVGFPDDGVCGCDCEVG